MFLVSFNVHYHLVFLGHDQQPSGTGTSVLSRAPVSTYPLFYVGFVVFSVKMVIYFCVWFADSEIESQIWHERGSIYQKGLISQKKTDHAMAKNERQKNN